MSLSGKLLPEERHGLGGPYDLRPLVQNVPLSADGEASSIISCVDYWDDHLYIGTSAGEILHFVSIPEADNEPTFILAARLSPGSSSGILLPKGIQQIVLLPAVSKACVLCNNILTFYSLPELSPAFGNKVMSHCSWIGSVDLNGAPDSDGIIIMVCVKNRIRLVRIGEEPKLVKNIEYPGCLTSARRGRFAAVADERSYALLDIDHQQKIPLFPISSAPEDLVDTGKPEGITSTAPTNRVTSDQLKIDNSGHGRSSSLGVFVSGLGRRQVESRSRSRERSGLETPTHDSTPPRIVNDVLVARPDMPEKALPPAPDEVPANTMQITSARIRQSYPSLRPHICSPLSTEFLLITGTTLKDPGVGIFVNCDGDVVRGTLEFSRYPEAIAVDGNQAGAENYVLASMQRHVERGIKRQGNPERGTGEQGNAEQGIEEQAHQEQAIQAPAIQEQKSTDQPTAELAIEEQTPERGIEIQRWDMVTSEKYWLPLSCEVAIGIGTTSAAAKIQFSGAGKLLCTRRFKILPDAVDSTDTEKYQDWELRRNQQEDDFSHQLGHTTTNLIVWAGSSVHWMARNPPILKWNAILDHILTNSTGALDQERILAVSLSIRGHEARNETEFLSLRYIRQKISIILAAELAANRYNVNPQVTEHILLEGELDPRVVLSMIPLLHANIIQGPQGIWIYAGLITLLSSQLSTRVINLESDEVLARPEEYDVVGLIKRYLMAWRQRKGFGSVPDEASVFASVDAALLHVLLIQDQQSLCGPGRTTSIRAELYSIVDEGVECFDRSVELLEEYRRLYVLSRLYQSRKVTAKVLDTWRRIIEGDQDDGGELIDGENEVRKYLIRVRDATLVEEYGTWLARRNPNLGVQVFSDDHGRVKLPPNQVVQLLQLRAPKAVKVYLEHLVFGKKNVQYASNLISYYLDNVLQVLETSEHARSMLADSYLMYRALPNPKPTYRQFIMQHSTQESWWYDRLRLLELIGGTHGADFAYNIAEILERIEPFESALVPETIILNGRQGRHEEALRLLTHGLGDYHTAINYCLLGGSSLFHPVMTGPKSTSREEQSSLFQALFLEFLSIQDLDVRLEQTSELLEHFGAWFDITLILERIPDEWSIDLLSAFLFGAFRRLIQERNEAMVVKALCGAENLSISVDFLDKCDENGPILQSV